MHLERERHNDREGLERWGSDKIGNRAGRGSSVRTKDMV
jgi:hypothetical protein